MGWLQNVDHQILLWIADTLRVGWMTHVQAILSAINNHGEIWMLIALVLLIRPKTRRCGMAMLLALLLGLLAGNLILKPWVARPRPFLTYPDIAALSHPGGFSFPSGHTCAAFACCVTWARCTGKRWLRCLCIAAALLMGFSRLYVGVHFPSDVLAGCAVGCLCAWLSWRAQQAVEARMGGGGR